MRKLVLLSVCALIMTLSGGCFYFGGGHHHHHHDWYDFSHFEHR
jgi:hypothetical protein